ncbi:MAG: hypothetical protein AAGG08_05135 [Actinomycetota bacterium]
MRPPECEACGERFDPSDGGGLVTFALSDAGRDFEQRAAEPGFVGHHPDQRWFCATHLLAAQEIAATGVSRGTRTELRHDVDVPEAQRLSTQRAHLERGSATDVVHRLDRGVRRTEVGAAFEQLCARARSTLGLADVASERQVDSDTIDSPEPREQLTATAVEVTTTWASEEHRVVLRHEDIVADTWSGVRRGGDLLQGVHALVIDDHRLFGSYGSNGLVKRITESGRRRAELAEDVEQTIADLVAAGGPSDRYRSTGNERVASACDHDLGGHVDHATARSVFEDAALDAVLVLELDRVEADTRESMHRGRSPEPRDATGITTEETRIGWVTDDHEVRLVDTRSNWDSGFGIPGGGDLFQGRVFLAIDDTWLHAGFEADGRVEGVSESGRRTRRCSILIDELLDQLRTAAVTPPPDPAVVRRRDQLRRQLDDRRRTRVTHDLGRRARRASVTKRFRAAAEEAAGLAGFTADDLDEQRSQRSIPGESARDPIGSTEFRHEARWGTGSDTVVFVDEEMYWNSDAGDPGGGPLANGSVVLGVGASRVTARYEREGVVATVYESGSRRGVAAEVIERLLEGLRSPS